MGPSLTIMSFLIWGLVLMPPLLFTAKWLGNKKRYPFPVAAWASSLMLVSFFLIPWLNLQPLKHFNLSWVFDAVPWLKAVGKVVGMEWLLNILEKLSGLEILFEPPGWLAFVLTARPLLWMFILLSAIVSLVSAWLVSWPVLVKGPGRCLTGSSFMLCCWLCSF